MRLWMSLAMQVFVDIMHYFRWFVVIFLAAYFANMAAFYRQGQLLLERLP